MAHPRVADSRDGLQERKVATNRINIREAPTKSGPQTWGMGRL